MQFNSIQCNLNQFIQFKEKYIFPFLVMVVKPKWLQLMYILEFKYIQVCYAVIISQAMYSLRVALYKRVTYGANVLLSSPKAILLITVYQRNINVVYFSSVRLGSARFGSVLLGSVLLGSVLFGFVWFDSLLFSSVCVANLF